MKKEIAKKWVKALRSGKYKQAKHALKLETKNGPRHCCLGVLCELYQAEQKKKQGRPLSARQFPPDVPEGLPKNVEVVGFSRDEYTTMLPPSVQRWAGMHDPSGEFRDNACSAVSLEAAARGEDCYSLADLNDAGASFKRIASIIENAVEEL